MTYTNHLEGSIPVVICFVPVEEGHVRLRPYVAVDAGQVDSWLRSYAEGDVEDTHLASSSMSLMAVLFQEIRCEVFRYSTCN